MFAADVLTFREFAMNEALPLSTIHNAVLDFLRDRDDVVVFGAQAVNAYVDEPRMTQDIDLMSPRAGALAEEIRQHLSERFHIAVRVREVAEGRGYRLYQVQKSGNRHLVDLRSVAELPLSQRIAQVLVMNPDELIASKVISFHQRRGKPKAGTDWRDLAMLLLLFPEFKTESGAVTNRLQVAGATPEIMNEWKKIVATDFQEAEDEDEF
jgi:ribonuclease BN (tRNA processing enzyme)